MNTELPVIDRSIALVGLMGTGKTTVGRRLAKRLNLPFVDADEEIETAAQMSIGDIFERYGEQVFRDGERRVIARLVEAGPHIIATGGGAFIQNDTRALLLKHAITIWLNADISILAERTARRNNRPLLWGKKPVEVLAELAERRNPIYAEADIHIESSSGPHQNTVEAIIEALTLPRQAK